MGTRCRAAGLAGLRASYRPAALLRVGVAMVGTVGLLGFAPPSIAAYVTSPKSCTPDSGAHSGSIRLHMTGVRGDGIRDTMTSYDVEYRRTSGWAYGSQDKNNEAWTWQDVFGDPYSYWNSADYSPVGRWYSRNIKDTSDLSNKYVALIFDRPNANDPSCFLQWKDQS